MTNRKIAMVNNNNIVAAVIVFNPEDPLEKISIDGLLSSPQSFEVDPYSESTVGWKYINGVEQAPEGTF